MRTSSGKLKVCVLLYYHRFGTDVTAHRTPEEAEKQVYRFMRVWLSEIEPPEKRSEIRQAIKDKHLRTACELWQDALDEHFEIKENVEVH